MSDQAPGRPVWWSISQDALLAMLHRVAAGEDPDLVYAEEYVNADVSHVPDEDDE